MKNYQHPNIVAYFDTLLYPQCNLPILVMELMHTSLCKYIREGHAMSMTIQISLSCDVAFALEYLHDRNLIHRDLCGDNVLLNHGQCVPIAKVSDFGISRMIVNPEQLSHSLTSFGHRHGYLPQEVFNYPTDYDASLDIYMFGVVMTQIAKKVPTVNTRHERQKLVAELGQHPLKTCIYQCLHEKKDDRSNAHKLYAKLSSLLESHSTLSSTTGTPVIADVVEGNVDSMFKL